MANILAVDDIEDNLFLLKMILENHHHTVRTALNGKDAIEIATSDTIDLVLLDLMMPGMNGLEVAAALKAHEKTRFVPVILLTAKKKEVNDVVEALDSGADEYLTKPFHETELIARVKSMLRMKSLFDKIEKDRLLMEQDLMMAQRVQNSLLPTDFPYPDKLKVEAYYEATSSLGGDYYDVIDVGGGVVAILMCDVSGHGASAALIVSMIKTIVISNIDDGLAPGTLAEVLNQRLISMIPEEQYISMFCCLIDIENRILIYARAGHPYPFGIAKG